MIGDWLASMNVDDDDDDGEGVDGDGDARWYVDRQNKRNKSQRGYCN